MTFAELRQITNLFLHGDWNVFLQDYGKSSSRYNRVTPVDSINLLDKMTDSSKKINFKRADREKKKYMDGLMKKLKEL